MVDSTREGKHDTSNVHITIYPNESLLKLDTQLLLPSRENLGRVLYYSF